MDSTNFPSDEEAPQNRGMSQLSFVDSSQDDNLAFKKTTTPSRSSIVVRKIPVGSSSKKRRRGGAKEAPASNEKRSKRQDQSRTVPKIAKRPQSSKNQSVKRTKTKTFEVGANSSDESSLGLLPRRSSNRASAASAAKRSAFEDSSDSDVAIIDGNKTRNADKKKKSSRFVKRKLTITKRADYKADSDTGDADLDTNDNDSPLQDKKSFHGKGRAGTAGTKTKVLHRDADNESDDDSVDFDMIPTEELDVPYAQKLGLPGEDAIILASSLSTKRKEPLRPGDVILYHHPMFVAGTRQSLRVTQVVRTDPNHHIPLELDNGEILPPDTRVKRIREYHGGKLYDHPGIFRSIQHFRFTAKSLSAKERSILPGLRSQVLRLMEKVVADANAALEQIPENFAEEAHNSTTTCTSSSSSSSSSDDNGEDLPSRVIRKTSERTNNKTKKAARSVGLPITKTSTTGPPKHRRQHQTTRKKSTRRLPYESDSSEDDSDGSSIGLRSPRYKSGSTQRKSSPVTGEGRSASQPYAGLSFSKRNSRRSGSASDSKRTGSSKQHRGGKLRKKQGQPSGTTPRDDTAQKNDSHLGPVRRQSIDPYEPKPVDKEQALWSSSSSDYESVASSTLSKRSSVTEQAVVPDNAKPRKALIITRRKSPHDSQPIDQLATTKREAAASTRSVFQPTELEPEDVGYAESSDDENLPENGAATFFPSARNEEDRGYSSIASSFTASQSPKRNSFVHRLKKNRRNKLTRPPSRSERSSGLGMQLSFQEIPRSGSRTDTIE